MKILPMRTSVQTVSIYDNLDQVLNNMIWMLNQRLDSLINSGSGWELQKLTNLHYEQVKIGPIKKA